MRRGPQSAWVITNSSGDSVMPCISADEYKMTQAQKDFGGGVCASRTDGWRTFVMGGFSGYTEGGVSATMDLGHVGERVLIVREQK